MYGFRCAASVYIHIILVYVYLLFIYSDCVHYGLHIVYMPYAPTPLAVECVGPWPVASRSTLSDSVL